MCENLKELRSPKRANRFTSIRRGVVITAYPHIHNRFMSPQDIGMLLRFRR